jgi:thioesterase domain-containing protein
MESDQGTDHCMMLVGECTPGQNHEHVAQRLQNLGITIAQIILARPLRLTNHETGTQFEQRDEAGTWKEVQPKRLASDVLSEYKSIVLARAIEFCLTDSRFETNGFQRGYLMEYIKHIYDP